ncbi:MAG: hypothetical protein AAF988_00150 [Pseudomonadota bacterium]
MTEGLTHNDILESDVEFITPKNVLKEKMGSGGIPQDLIKKSQAFIENNTIEFLPYAEEHIKNISNLSSLSQQTYNEEARKDYLEEISQNIMQLKASGSMFSYPSLTMISDIALNFAEQSTALNDDFYQIIEAYSNGALLVTTKKAQLITSPEVKALSKELNSAIERYNKKYNSK